MDPWTLLWDWELLLQQQPQCSPQPPLSPLKSALLAQAPGAVQPALPSMSASCCGFSESAGLVCRLTGLVFLVDFFFNSLVVGVPCSLIFRPFWLFIDFRLIVVLLVVWGSEGYLLIPPSWLELEFQFFAHSCPDLQTPFVEEAIFTPFYASTPFATEEILNKLIFFVWIYLLIWRAVDNILHILCCRTLPCPTTSTVSPHYFCASHIVLDCNLAVRYIYDYFPMQTVKFWRPGSPYYFGFVSLAGYMPKQVI